VACEVAAAVGVSEIYNLEGGILEWVAHGQPVEK
jgi:rhodanese-related sulfurtransferase